MKNWTIGVAFASAGLDLTHEDAAIGESDASLSADGIAVDLQPIADEPQFEPVRAGRAVVGVHPTRSGEVEVAIMVVVGPRANIGGRDLGKPRGLRNIDERNRRTDGGVSKEHGKILLTETRVGVDGGEEEVERAVIVEVAAGWARVALLVINAAFAEVFEPKCVRGTEVAEEPALRLVAARVHMGEVAREEVDVAVAVEIAEAGADRVAALEARARGNRVALGGLVGELRVAVVDEERVRLQPVVRRVDVEIAVLVEVARGDAARSALGAARRELERLAVVVQQQQRRKGRLRFPVLEATDVDIDEAVVVEVADGGAARNGRREVGRKIGDRHESDRAAGSRKIGDRHESDRATGSRGFAHPAQDPRRRKRHKVAHTVVVDVRDHARAGRVDAREALAIMVDPHRAAHPEVGPPVAVHIAPRRMLAAAGDADFRGAVDESLCESI